MRYLLMVCADPAVERVQNFDELWPETEAWVKEMDARGVRVLGDVLAEAHHATTIRVRDGQTVVSDGPFAETKEFIGGIDILECADLDEAMEVAAKHPVAKYGVLELRPFGRG